MNKRVFVYIRVSTSRQAEEGFSIPQQMERLQKYCEAMGWILVKIYTDDGYTGADMERPGLKNMIADIEKGLADIVLVDKLDRLSRSQFDTLYLIQKVFDIHNVGFVSRAEAFDTSTTFGKAMVGILAVFAELERSRIKERTRDGKEGRAKEGKYQGGGKVPIGYRYNSLTGSLDIDDYESIQIREVFEMFNNRMSVRSIAKELNNKGYTTSYGKWQEVTVRYVLQNKVYLGYTPFKGELYEGKHDPIITEEVFKRAEKLTAERSKQFENKRQGRRYKSPLGGIIFCGCCTGRYMFRKNGVRNYYICASRAKSDKYMIKDPNCKNKSYREDELNEIIYNEIRKLKTEPSYFEEIRQSIDTKPKQIQIQKRIDQIAGQQEKMIDLYTLGSIDIETMRKKTESLNQEKQALEIELATLQNQEEKITKKEVVEISELLDEAIKSGNPYQVHEVVAELIEKVEIENDKIKIHWNF